MKLELEQNRRTREERTREERTDDMMECDPHITGLREELTAEKQKLEQLSAEYSRKISDISSNYDQILEERTRELDSMYSGMIAQLKTMNEATLEESRAEIEALRKQVRCFGDNYKRRV